jgi:hypothetical protein
VLVSREPGQQTIKEIRFPYFDPTDRQYHIALLDEIALEVLPGMDPVTGAPIESAQRSEVRLLSEDIRFIKLDSGEFRSTHEQLFSRPVFWVFLFLPLVGVAGGLVYRKHRDRMEGDQAYARSRQAGKIARAHLAEARQLASNPSDLKAFYAACERALSGFAADKLNVARAGMMADQLGVQLRSKDVDTEIVQDYLRYLELCAEKRFSPDQGEIHQAGEFLDRVEKMILRLDGAIS